MSGACKQEPCQARVGRKADQLPPQRRDRRFGPVRLNRSEHPEEPDGLLKSPGLWGVEPRKAFGLAEGEELEERAGEIGAEDLGEIGGGAVLV